jgi:predicted transcriptional regulator/ribosomal protein L40E
MTRGVLTVSPEITVQQLVSDYFLVHPHEGYPVMKDGQLLGLVTLQSARAIPKEQRATETVAQAMVPYERAPIVQSDGSALDAMHRMARERVEMMLVTEGGRLLGVVTRGDLIKTIQTRQELELHPVWQPAATPVAVQYCVQCGAQLQVGTQICPHCNAKQPEQANLR